MNSNAMSILTISNLKKRFNLEAGFFARFGRYVYAVNDISFFIGKNEAYGLVGESGCGKTTTARLLVRMYEADSGEIIYRQNNTLSSVAELKKEALRKYREKVRYVFRDPARSLNPRMTVYEVLVSGCRKPLKKSGLTEKDLREKAAVILEEVGLQAADLEKRPSEFSGGQRQRISIARALLMEPEILICDEVVSALDVSIQGQILNLLLDIRQKRDISFLFIAHDLKVACYFCDRIGVMYKGELMEEAPASDLYQQALHPYTQMLFESASGIPDNLKKETEEKKRKTGNLNTEKIKQLNPSCPFAHRCNIATERCFKEHPELKEIKQDHKVRCFLSAN